MKRWLQRFDDALNALDNPVAIIVLLLPVFIQWIVPLVRSSFWLDETATWWTTNRGLQELFIRCTYWPGSILYNSFILVLRSVGIHREWLLRMPSLVALLFATAILFDLARRWFSRRVAIAAVVFFCAQPWVVFAAADARPYAFGLLTVVLSTWLMLRWLEVARAGYACAYGVVAGLMMHFQMLFASVLVFHGVFVIATAPRNRKTMRQGAMAVGIVVALMLPLLPQYWFAFRERGTHTFPASHGVVEFARQFLPTMGMLVSVVIAGLVPRWSGRARERIAGRFVFLAVLWAAIPMCMLYGAEKLSGENVLVARYALPYVPGIALCFGLILEYLSRRLRTGLVLAVFLIPWALDCWRGEFGSHTFSGNWAAAIEFVDKGNGPALMRSPFPESDYWDWQNVQMNDNGMYAPLSYYRSSADWHPLPASFSAKAVTAIDSFVETQRAKRQNFFFATLDDGTAEEVYVAYFRKTAGNGAQFREAGDFEGVRVFRMQW